MVSPSERKFFQAGEIREPQSGGHSTVRGVIYYSDKNFKNWENKRVDPK